MFELKWKVGLRVYFGYVAGKDDKAALMLLGGTRMAGTGTSRKPKQSWLGKPRKLKTGARVRSYDPGTKLIDPAFVRKAVLEAIEVGDDEAVAEIIQAHLGVLNRSRAASQMRVSRQFIHRLISGARKPSLPTLGAFMRLLNREQASPAVGA